MKKTKTIYWILTALLAVLMIFSAIPDILYTQQAVTIISTHLGYPSYLIPFIGVAKLLGAVTILLPGLRRLKEWAYAGFVFDLAGAVYSAILVGDPVGAWIPVLFGFALIAGSYIFYHKKLKAVALSNAK